MNIGFQVSCLLATPLCLFTLMFCFEIRTCFFGLVVIFVAFRAHYNNLQFYNLKKMQLRCSALREENDLERIRAWNNNLPLPRPSSNYDTESRVMGSASTFSMSEWVKTWCDQRNHTGYWTSVYAAVVIQWDNLKFCTLVIHSWVLSECVSHLCSVSVSISGFRPDEAHYCFVSQIWYLHLDVVGWFQYTRLPQSMTKFWIRTSCFIS